MLRAGEAGLAAGVNGDGDGLPVAAALEPDVCLATDGTGGGFSPAAVVSFGVA